MILKKYNDCVTELRSRYSIKGVAYNKQRDAVLREMSAVDKEAKRNAPSTKYMNGVCDGKKYMTTDDFVSYFNDRHMSSSSKRITFAEDKMSYAKGAKAANASEGDNKGSRNIVARQSIRNVSRKPDGTARIGRPAMSGKTDNSSDMSGATRAVETVKNAIESATVRYFPTEDRAVCKTEEKKRIPALVMVAAFTVMMSLMLIVGSSVILNQAGKDMKALEQELGELRAEEERLAIELQIKNDFAGIESRAKDELGMISSDYVPIKYISGKSEEYVEITKDEKKENNALAALLSAIAGK